MTTPSPQTWTLRLKYQKTTIFLHTNPLSTFTTIKQHLLAALAETSISTSDSTTPTTLPTAPSDIQFGRPINPLDPKSGFELGEWEYEPADEVDGQGNSSGKGKGKAKGGKLGKGDGSGPEELAGSSNIKDCPKGAGLRDNAVLAFRWRGDGTGWEDREDEDEEEDMWGVRIPSYNDEYGVANEGDLGGRAEFQG